MLPLYHTIFEDSFKERFYWFYLINFINSIFYTSLSLFWDNAHVKEKLFTKGWIRVNASYWIPIFRITSKNGNNKAQMLKSNCISTFLQTLLKKWGFPFRFSSVNVSKSAVWFSNRLKPRHMSEFVINCLWNCQESEGRETK